MVTDSENIAGIIQLWRNQGMSDAYHYLLNDGFNWRMTELQAAVAIPQLKRLAGNNAKRTSIAMIYDEAFRTIETLKVPPLEGSTVWHQYTLRHEKSSEISSMLNYRGIDARVYYPQLASPRDQWELTPVAYQATKEIFSIPVHHHLTAEEVNYIKITVAEIVKEIDND